MLALDSLHGKMHICVYCDCLPNMGEFETNEFPQINSDMKLNHNM